jgi:hypothetical protein
MLPKTFLLLVSTMLNCKKEISHNVNINIQNVRKLERKRAIKKASLLQNVGKFMNKSHTYLLDLLLSYGSRLKFIYSKIFHNTSEVFHTQYKKTLYYFRGISG